MTVATDRRCTPLGKVLAGIGAAGFVAAAAAHVWARHIEIHLFEVREFELRILPEGSGPVRILHMSDAHMLPEQKKKRAFLRHLAALKPDLIINTGDNVASEAAIAPLLDDLAPLLQRPGAFVLGSNDKFAAGRRNLFRYLLPDPRPANYRERFEKPQLPVEELVEGLASGGWKGLDNARSLIQVSGADIELVGVDDPHLDHDEFPPPSAPHRPRSGRTSIKIGVAHAPYRRVLDEFVEDGCDLILAGHTHGGQLAVPFFGALVTNCDLHRSQAKGVSLHRGVPLHVSAGLGASPKYNMRFACRPEVSVLTLRPRKAAPPA